MAETSKRNQEGADKLCFERRAATILKKSEQLQILCGIKVSVVIISPDGKKLQSWPPDLKDVKALLEASKDRPGKCVRKTKRKAPNNSHGQEILNPESSKDIATMEGGAFLMSKKRDDVATMGGAAAFLMSKKRDDVAQNLGPFYDDLGGEYKFLNHEENQRKNMGADNGNSATVKGKEIVVMENIDSDTLQETDHLGAYQNPSTNYGFGANLCDENGNGELTGMNYGMGNHFNQGFGSNLWHHGTNMLNQTMQSPPSQNFNNVLDQSVPYSAALNNNVTNTEFRELLPTNFGLQSAALNNLNFFSPTELSLLNAGPLNSAEPWELRPWNDATHNFLFGNHFTHTP